jgi:hypothetical protein
MGTRRNVVIPLRGKASSPLGAARDLIEESNSGG